MAHPLYGEVRRRRAAATRLRRLRGLVAAELAAADDHDDIQVVVRRATLSLDSDLTTRRRPTRKGSPRRRLAGGSAPCRSTCAKRQSAPERGPEPNFVRAHALSWLGRGEEADAVLAEIHTGAVDRRRATPDWRSCGPATCSGRSVTPRARKKSSTRRRAPHHRRRAAISMPSSTVYWFATDQPDAAMQASRKPCIGRSARRRWRRDSLGRWPPYPRMRGAPPKRWPSRTRDIPLRHALSMLRT